MIVGILLTTVTLLFRFLSVAILARVIISWLPMAGVRVDMYNPLIRVVYIITDPLLNPIRRFATFRMMDFSPIVALILLQVIEQVVVSAITQL